MFNPWLVPYYPQSMQQAPANWIKQVLSNNDVLLPWSELYTERAKLMIHSLVDCLLFMLDMLPASESVLGNLFFWYEIHFAKVGVPRHILKPIHAAMILLPWHLFQPQSVHIDCIYRCLQQVRRRFFFRLSPSLMRLTVRKYGFEAGFFKYQFSVISMYL